MATAPTQDDQDEKSDWKVVLQFFLVPLALVAVLVTVFFGFQVLRTRRPDARATLEDLKTPGRFLLPWVGDPKRWQSGYDLSLLLRGAGPSSLPLEEMAAAFRDARRSEDLKLRRYLALALARPSDPRAREVLTEGSADADNETRLYCVWGLARLGGRESLGVLRAAAGDADPGVRKMAVFALGDLGDRDAVPALRTALADTVPDVRVNAAIALARLGDASGVPLLAETLRAWTGPDGRAAGDRPADSSPALNAVRALALLDDAAARGALRDAAEHARVDEIRDTARRALEATHGEAHSTLP